MDIIRTEHLKYEYVRQEEGEAPEIRRAVEDVSLSVKEGDFLAILGRNGSGKSTFVKQLNALLYPSSGTVWIGGMDTRDDAKLWDIRSTAGMVFQNPDNQIVASLVEDDVGFGPENLGVPTAEILSRVEAALKATGMTAFAKTSPNRLSGGQKQRVAIAGVMAMRSRCIILDEPTAMLDPAGRREVLKTVHELNRQEQITVLLITHHMEEAVEADRVIALDAGRLVLDGTPREVFSQTEKLTELGLELPRATRLAARLRHRGLALPAGILTMEELAAALEQLRDGKEVR